MKLRTMDDLYLSLLQDSYDSELQLVDALPKMADAAASPDLRKAFASHCEETKKQAQRLEKVFDLLGVKHKRNTCEATQGLVKEAEEVIDEKGEEGVVDAGLIACGQKVEHYEIASYGTLAEFARVLGYRDQRQLLLQTLEEERGADQTLTSIAEGHVNRMAKMAHAA